MVWVPEAMFSNAITDGDSEFAVSGEEGLLFGHNERGFAGRSSNSNLSEDASAVSSARTAIPKLWDQYKSFAKRGHDLHPSTM